MKKIQVIGESCRDEFVYCEAKRLAPDLPVPILTVVDKTFNPGMASNVFRNIKSKHSNIELITNDNWQEITKIRYVHDSSNHMFFRVDSLDVIPRINLENLNLDADLLIISDYDKGFLSRSDIEWICGQHKNVFLDTKKIVGDWASNAKYIKINDYEYRNSQSSITSALLEKIIHTVGPDGCNYQGINYPVAEHEVRDTSGAGDSFMAALVLEYLKTQDIIKSIISANIAASEVVQQRGVGII